MRLRVDRELFGETVSWVAHSIQSNPAKPILGGILLTASDDGTLHLSSHDPELGAKAFIDAAVDEVGTCVVNGRLLAGFVNECPKKPIDLTLEGNKLELVCGAAHMSMSTLPVEDYPDEAQMPELAGTIDGAVWQNAVSQVASSASNDDTLPLLVSICIEIDGPNLTLMATDRYRLAVRTLTWNPEKPDIKARVLVKASRLAEIAKKLGSLATVDIFVDEESNNLGFSAGGRRNTVRRIEGDYPQVLGLFPNETNSYAVIDRKEMINAIKRANLVVEKNAPLRLTFSESNVVLEAGQGDSAQVSEMLEAALYGEDISIAFNPSYLSEGLKAMETDYARISFTHASKPAIITAQEKIDSDEMTDFKLLQMPIRLYE